LHEVLDDKFFKEDIKKQKNKVLELLKNLNLEKKQIEKIFYIINNI